MRQNDKRKYHTLKKNAASTVPYRILFIDTETSKKSADKTQEIHTADIAWTCYSYRKYKNDFNWKEHWNFHTDRKEVLKHIEGLTQPKKPLWVVGSNVFFDLQAIGFIEHFTLAGWKLRFIYSGGMSFILSIVKEKCSIKCISTQNFAPHSVETLGKYLNKPKIEIDLFNSTLEEKKVYCRRDTEIIRDFIYQYLEFLYHNDMGKFCYTRASQALGYYRHKHLNNTIYIHAHPESTILEKTGYYGGRTECFYIGRFTGKKWVSLDVNSMYPYVMKNNDFPVKLVNYVSRPSLEYVKNNLDNYCFTARVIIDTTVPAYACRVNKKVCFPVGTFETVVNTPALKRLIEHGELKKILEFSMYEKADIFSTFIQDLYKKKVRYKRENNKVWFTMVKYLMNSLYGKFGQQAPVRIQDQKTDSTATYRESYIDYDTGEHCISQCLFGRKQVYSGKAPTKDTFFTIPAHVTEYARLYLWGLIETVGIENVWYCDTDSLVITEDQLPKLRKYMNKYKLGMLDIEKKADHVEFYAPKDYVFGKYVKRKGVRSDAVKLQPTVFLQKQFPSIYTVMRQGLNVGFPIKTVHKKLTRIYNKGIVTDTGKVKPMSLVCEV